MKYKLTLAGKLACKGYGVINKGDIIEDVPESIIKYFEVVQEPKQVDNKQEAKTNKKK